MRIVPILCGCLLTTSLSAQIARDDWIATTFTDYITSQVTGGLWHVDAAMTTATKLANQTANMPAANAVAIDQNGIVYYATLRTNSVPVPNPCEIFEVVITGGTVVLETQLTTGPIDGGSVSALTLRRDQIWFVTDAGNVGWIPKTGGAATIVLNLATFGVNGLGQSITTNGREIFVGTSHSASNPDPANVWSFDAESASPSLVPLAFLAGSAFAMDLARDGQVLVGRISGRLYLVDPLIPNQTAVWLNSTAAAPQGNSNGTAINPWSNIVGNVPGYGASARSFAFYDVASASWPVTLTLDTAIPSGVASCHEEPFFLYGHGCPGSNGLEPRIGWRGMPIQGQSYDITLRDGDPQPGIAFLVIGVSDAAGPFGPLPFDLGVLGATGCSEFSSVEASVLALLQNGAGTYTLNVPVTPAAVGAHFFAQWAVGSQANTFGFVVSDAVAIRLR
ncbi:MAG: hypothetical protein U1E73_06295 [Planctomycetota bacterium]